LAFKERIDELNTCDPSKYLRFLCAGKQVGSIRSDRAALLRDFRDTFVIAGKDVSLAPALGDRLTRTEAMTRVIAVLFGKGEIPRLRRESYSVVPLDDRTLSTPLLFEVDRAACPYFGIRAFGVHVNGFVREGGSYSLWIARRSKTAGVHPNKLDNMVAGGQPAELTVFANMMKEAEEEASIPPSLAKTAKEAGYISYCVETGAGLGPATMFIYDLELTADFVPRNADGELQYFELLPIRDVLRLVGEGEEFKPNSNLVILDFCLRHGIIGPDHSEYEAIKSGLHR